MRQNTTFPPADPVEITDVVRGKLSVEDWCSSQIPEKVAYLLSENPLTSHRGRYMGIMKLRIGYLTREWEHIGSDDALFRGKEDGCLKAKGSHEPGPSNT